MKPIVWVEGVIAAGKSRLTGELETALGFRGFPEPVADKGYLELFYENPKRWAFSIQVEMLRRRWELHRLAMLECKAGNVQGCIMDRGMPGDRVFAWLNYRAGNIHPLEWDTYEALFEEFMSVPHLQPSVLVYLDVDAEAAFSRIKKRGRPSEELVTLDYLADLIEAYKILLGAIERGDHPWSHGLKVIRVPWSEPNLPIEPIVQKIRLALVPKPKPIRPDLWIDNPATTQLRLV